MKTNFPYIPYNLTGAIKSRWPGFRL